MKSILTLILIVPSLYNSKIPFSAKEKYQSSVITDKMFLEKLNQYRSYYKVKPLVWSDEIYTMSSHHSDYLIKADTVSHFEDKLVPNFKTIYSLHNRANYFGIALPIAENVVGGFVTIVVNKRTPFSDFVRQIWKVKLADVTPEVQVIYYCIYDWHLSKNGHKEIMLSEKFTTGAFSLRYNYSTINQHDRFFNGAKTQEVRFFAVMNVGK